MKNLRSAAASALALVLLSPLPSAAQATRAGTTFMIGGSTVPVMFPDVARDTINDRFLVVSGNGFIEGQLLNANGAKIGVFTVNASRGIGGQVAQTPRAVFCADLNGGAGGYFVTWQEIYGSSFSRVHGRMLNASGQPLTGDIELSPEVVAPGLTTNWGMGPAIAYSTVSKEFLVTWMGFYTTLNDIHVTRVNLAGTVLQATQRITAGTADWERDPSVAYNPHTDEFLVTYAGAKAYAFIGAQRIKAGSGALLGPAVELTQTLAAYVPAVAYNTTTQNYVVAWYHRSASAAATFGITLRGSDLAVVVPVHLMSSRFFAYDALDMKYNTKSGDFLMVSYGSAPQNWEDAAVPINADGTPYDNGFILTNTPDVRALRADPANNDGNFSPRLIDDSARGRYLAVTASVFAAVYGQFAQSSATGGSPAPAPPPPPPAGPVSRPVWVIDTPGNNTVVPTTGFLISGWATDQGSTSGVGIDVVVCWAFPKNGAPAILAGIAQMGVPRPDVGAYLGAQFTNSGWGLLGNLPAGDYTLSVYAHSTVDNSWGTPKQISARVVAPVSQPRMWVDLPAQNSVIPGSSVVIAGWALDLGAAQGTGVDTLHIYAYPKATNLPVFLGTAVLGDQRPDVGGFFGQGRFNGSGFHLITTLAPGDYTIVVYSHSVVANDFNAAQAVAVTVR
jgi:hypothetical protein